jgi:OOP family OmpA-OmpF porin
MRLFTLMFALIGLLAGAAGAWLYAHNVITKFETRNLNRLNSALHAAEIAWPALLADGQLLYVSGPAPDDEAAGLVVQMAHDVLPAAVVVDETTRMQGEAATNQANSPTPPRLEILRSDAGISLMGRAPSGPALTALHAAVSNLSNASNVTNLVEETSDTPAPDWNAAVEFALRTLPQTPEATLTIRPGRLTIDAVASSANWQLGLAEMLEQMRPEDVVLELNIIAPMPVISPFYFLVDLSSDPVQMACTARNADEESRIITAAINAGLAPGDHSCNIGIGAPSEQWGNVVATALNTLSELGGGRLEIVNTDVTFSNLTAPLDILGQTEIGLRAELPAIYSLRPLSVTVVDTVETTEAPASSGGWGPRFIAVRDAQGAVVLRGMVRDNLNSKVVTSYAEARFGYEAVSSDLSEAPDLPDGWQARIFTSIDALNLLETGQATVTPTTFQLRGTGSLPDLEAELDTMLRAALGADNYRLQVIQTDPPVVEEVQMDERLCASRLSGILADNQINFAPSSAVIEETSAPVITTLADLLHQCRHVDFQIGGHTDSQGREEMNAALSQSRADSVLNSILASNQLMGKLTAFGYGESRPIATNDTEDGRALNRRIEIIPLAEVEAAEAEAAAAAAAPEETADEQN